MLAKIVRNSNLKSLFKQNFGVYKNVQTIEDIYLQMKNDKDFLNADNDYKKILNKLSISVYKSMQTEYEKSVKNYFLGEVHKKVVERLLDKYEFKLKDEIEKKYFTLSRQSGEFTFDLKIKNLSLSDRNDLIKKLNDYLVNNNWKTPDKEEKTDFQNFLAGQSSKEIMDIKEYNENFIDSNMKMAELKMYEEFDQEEVEFDDRYFMYVDGKILPPKNQEFLHYARSGRSQRELSTDDPFRLRDSVFYNLEFDIEMTRKGEQTTFVFNGNISNK